MIKKSILMINNIIYLKITIILTQIINLYIQNIFNLLLRKISKFILLLKINP